MKTNMKKIILSLIVLVVVVVGFLGLRFYILHYYLKIPVEVQNATQDLQELKKEVAPLKVWEGYDKEIPATNEK